MTSFMAVPTWRGARPSITCATSGCRFSQRLGVEASSVELAAWGWYPVGKGEVRARIRSLGGSRAMLKPLDHGN
jgi:RNA 3'-terminal phosphate cyclase